MSSVLVTVYIQATSQEKRKELLDIIDNIIEYGKREQGLLRYVVGEPVNDNANTKIYLLEEYATEEVRQAHLASEPVKILLSRLSAGSDAIVAPPEIHVLPPALSYQRAGLTNFDQAELIILAYFGYQQGLTRKALEGWRGIVDNCQANEPPVLAYAVMEDVEHNTIRTAEVYASAEFAGTTHLRSEAVKFNQEQNGMDRDGRKGVVKLKPVAGFLGR